MGTIVFQHFELDVSEICFIIFHKFCYLCRLTMDLDREQFFGAATEGRRNWFDPFHLLVAELLVVLAQARGVSKISSLLVGVLPITDGTEEDFELITTDWLVTYFPCHEASVRVPFILAIELSSLHFYDSNKQCRTKSYNNLQITRRSHGPLWKMPLHLSPDGQLHGTRQEEESSETISARSGGHCTHSGWHGFLVNLWQNLILFSSIQIFQWILRSHCDRNWFLASQSVVYVLYDFMYSTVMKWD